MGLSILAREEPAYLDSRSAAMGWFITFPGPRDGDGSMLRAFLKLRVSRPAGAANLCKARARHAGDLVPLPALISYGTMP